MWLGGTHCADRSDAGSPFLRGHPRVLSSPAVANEKLASVSAFEHPDLTCAGHGLLDRFPDQLLLRKEVIQPHLPVRLPCYDFVPIADPAFDGSLP